MLAHSSTFAAYLLYTCAALLVIGQIWMLVVAAQRSILWLLGVLFVPFVSIIFLFVESRALRPLLLIIIGCVGGVWALVGLDTGKWKDMSIRQKVEQLSSKGGDEGADSGDSESSDSTPLESSSTAPQATLEARKERIRAWQLELDRKKKVLNPNDAAAKAAFDRELAEYLGELQKVKDDMAAQSR